MKLRNEGIYYVQLLRLRSILRVFL